jgi:hypothetical protein
MVATAAHLADHVLPPLPVRQWVLAVPKRLRYFLQRDADLQGAALRLFLRAVESCLRAHSPGSGPAARLGAVAFIHRVGSSLNAHLHFHCVVIDGVFDRAAGGVVFHAATTRASYRLRRTRASASMSRGLAPKPPGTSGRPIVPPTPSIASPGLGRAVRLGISPNGQRLVDLGQAIYAG